jgi:hypothetical protein
VREVGVHLDQQLGAGLQRVREPGHIRLAEAALGRAMQDLDRWQRRRELIGDRPGPVRRVVVDDQDPVIAAGRTLELAERGAQGSLEVRGLVVGRHYQPNRRAHRPRSVMVGPGGVPRCIEPEEAASCRRGTFDGRRLNRTR